MDCDDSRVDTVSYSSRTKMGKKHSKRFIIRVMVGIPSREKIQHTMCISDRKPSSPYFRKLMSYFSGFQPFSHQDPLFIQYLSNGPPPDEIYLASQIQDFVHN